MKSCEKRRQGDRDRRRRGERSIFRDLIFTFSR
jgi:hypothetical protein